MFEVTTGCCRSECGRVCKWRAPCGCGLTERCRGDERAAYSPDRRLWHGDGLAGGHAEGARCPCNGLRCGGVSADVGVPRENRGSGFAAVRGGEPGATPGTSGGGER